MIHINEEDNIKGQQLLNEMITLINKFSKDGTKESMVSIVSNVAQLCAAIHLEQGHTKKSTLENVEYMYDELIKENNKSIN